MRLGAPPAHGGLSRNSDRNPTTIGIRIAIAVAIGDRSATAVAIPVPTPMGMGQSISIYHVSSGSPQAREKLFHAQFATECSVTASRIPLFPQDLSTRACFPGTLLDPPQRRCYKEARWVIRPDLPDVRSTSRNPTIFVQHPLCWLARERFRGAPRDGYFYSRCFS